MTGLHGQNQRDHGGGLDAAMAQYGGQRSDWLDLSTGINPTPYPIPTIPSRFWKALPDTGDQNALLSAARSFWNVPKAAEIVAASGVSALITALPRLAPADTVSIPQPTYNEHEASFRAFGWAVTEKDAAANVYVHPNNPDGRLWDMDHILENHKTITIIDESFCDICSEHTRIELAKRPGFVVLKGLGKFWGLAGLRLGFAIALPQTISAIMDMIGPWAISGPAQHIGRAALQDTQWADQMRASLSTSAQRLDAVIAPIHGQNPRGTSLFRLYDVADAQAFHEKLLKGHILSRIFPYSDTMVRIGLPGTQAEWSQLQTVLER